MADDIVVATAKVVLTPTLSDDFRQSAQAQLERQRIDPKNVDIVPVLDDRVAELNAEMDALAKSLDRQAHINVGVDFDGTAINDYIERNVLPSLAKPLELRFDEGSEASIQRTLDQVRKVFGPDGLGHSVLSVDTSNADIAVRDLQNALDAIAKEKIRLQLQFDADAAGLELAKAQALTDAARATLTIDPRIDPASVEQAVAKVAALLAAQKDLELKLQVVVDPIARAALERDLAETVAKLEATRTELAIKPTLDAKAAAAALAQTEALRQQFERGVGNVDIGFQVDADRVQAALDRGAALVKSYQGLKAAVALDLPDDQQALLQAALERVQAQLRDLAVDARVTPTLNQAALKLVDTSLLEAARDRAVDFVATLNDARLSLVDATLGALSADRRVALSVVLDNASQAATAASLALLTRTRQVSVVLGGEVSKFSGLGLVLDALQAKFEVFANFDAFAVGVGKAATAISLLAMVTGSAITNILSLTQSILSILPAALALPAILSAAGAGVLVFKSAFADFATIFPGVQAQWAALQQSLSAPFWTFAQQGMTTLLGYLPTLQAGMAQVATGVGYAFDALLTGFTTAFSQLDLTALLGNIASAFALLAPSLMGFGSALGTILTAGGNLLPQMATSLGALVDEFNTWVASNGVDGLTTKMQTAFAAIGSLLNVLQNAFAVLTTLMGAASASGGATLGTLADALDQVNDSLTAHLPAIEQILTGLTSGFHNVLAAALPAIGDLVDALGPVIEDVLPAFGTTLGQVIGAIATALADPAVMAGLSDLITGLGQGLSALEPAFGPIADKLGALMSLIGTFLSGLGPIFATAFGTLASILEAILPALTPIVAALQGGLLTVITALVDPMRQFGDAIAAAFASTDMTSIITGLVAAISALLPAVGPLLSVVSSLLPPILSVVAALLPVIVNLVAALAPVITQIAGLLGTLVGSIVTQLAGFLPLVGQILVQIVAALAPLLTMLVSLLSAVIQPLLPLIETLVTALLPLLVPIIQLVATALSLVMAILTPILQIALPLLTGLLSVIITVVAGVADAILSVLGGAFQFIEDGIVKLSTGITGFLQGWQDTWNRVLAYFQNLWTKLLDWVLDTLGIHSPSQWFLDLATNMLAGLLNGLTAGWQAIVAFFTAAFTFVTTTATTAFDTLVTIVTTALTLLATIVSAGWETVKSLFTSAGTAITTAAGTAWTAVKSAFTTGVTTAVTTVAALPGQALTALGNLSTYLVSTGEDFVRGFINGITNMGGALADKARSLATSALSSIESALGIGSPSKEMHTLGVFTMQGFLNGAESQYDTIRRSLGGLASDVAATPFALPNPTGGGLSAVAAMIAAASQSGGAARVLNYYAAPGSSLGSQEDLFVAAGRARMSW